MHSCKDTNPMRNGSMSLLSPCVSALPAGLTVMAMKGVLSPGLTCVPVRVCNNSTRSVYLPKCTVIAQCQAVNVVPAPTVQMESVDNQTVSDNGS